VLSRILSLEHRSIPVCMIQAVAILSSTAAMQVRYPPSLVDFKGEYFFYFTIDQPGIFTYTDSACLSPSPSFQYITTGCVAATRYQCATTYSLPLSSNYAVL